MLLVTDKINYVAGNWYFIYWKFSDGTSYLVLVFNFSIAIQLAWLVYVSYHYFSPESSPEKIIAIHYSVI